MDKKWIVLCLVLSSLSVSAARLQKKAFLSPMEQLHRTLAGKGVRVEPNSAYPEESLVQRVTFIVDQKGTLARFYMDYTFTEDGRVVKRELRGGNYVVLWSAMELSREEIDRRFKDCVEACNEQYRQARGRLPRGARFKNLKMCIAACDLFWYGGDGAGPEF